MSDLSVERARRGGISALWSQPLHVPLWCRWPAAFALAVLTLPHDLYAPGPGPDASWAAGLAVAREQGLHVGRDIVFTYGPLGFLVTENVYVLWQTILGIVLALVLQTVLCRTLLHVLRALPVTATVVVACIVASVPTTEAEAALAVVLALSIALLTDGGPLPRWVPCAGGAAAAALLLVTPAVGIEALLVAALVAGFGRSGALRGVGELVGSFCAALVGLWFATGNAAADVLPWWHGTLEFVSGYTAGMALYDPARHGDIVKGLALLPVLLLLLIRSSAGAPRLRRIAIVLACGVVGFGVLKEGFVRLDGHTAIFFGMCAVAAAAMARGRMRFVAAGVALLASVWSFSAAGVGVATMVDYPLRMDAFVSKVRLLARPTKRDLFIERARAAEVARLHLPPAVLRDLRAHTVDVQPIETSAVWALGLSWRPEPVFQSYAVLTPKLDRLNADFLTSSRAPERILRVQPLDSIDGRNPAFDAPTAFLATICNYRETFVSGIAEVLARSTDRCATPRALGSADVRSGSVVHVPQADKDELVYARVNITRSPAEHLREFLWKPTRNPGIAIGARDFRLVAATASGPLVMQIPRAAGIAVSSLAAPHVRVFRLVRVSGTVHIDFFAVRLRASR
jgi:hypothetical protein